MGGAHVRSVIAGPNYAQLTTTPNEDKADDESSTSRSTRGDKKKHHPCHQEERKLWFWLSPPESLQNFLGSLPIPESEAPTAAPIMDLRMDTSVLDSLKKKWDPWFHYGWFDQSAILDVGCNFCDADFRRKLLEVDDEAGEWLCDLLRESPYPAFENVDCCEIDLQEA